MKGNNIQDEIITVSKKLDFNRLENKQKRKKQDEDEQHSEDEERQKFIEARRRALVERLSRMHNDNVEEEEAKQESRQSSSQKLLREFSERRQLIESGYDPKFLSEDLVKLANEILAKREAKIIVNAITCIHDNPVNVSSLQSSLHIGYPRAKRLIDMLLELGVLEQNGLHPIKSEKISKAFVAYLKHKLDDVK